MIIAPLGSGGLGGSTESRNSLTQSQFALTGAVNFSPFYVPGRFSIGKERNKDRSDSFCGGENITDTGSKNREIHIAGRIRESELESFNAVLDHNADLELVTPGWVGEVEVLDGEYEGPVAIEPQTHQMLYGYSLNLVSTGQDEPNQSGDGIISRGTDSSYYGLTPNEFASE